MSGSLVRITAFDTIRFRDEFFVDLVDTDFYYQVRESGHFAVSFDEAVILHTLGVTIDFQGRPSSYENSKRIYLLARNGTSLVLEGRADVKLIWVMLSSLGPAMYVEGIKAPVRSFLRGLFHGFIRKAAPELPRALPPS
jgi:GT2 family glycosyltransferase